MRPDLWQTYARLQSTYAYGGSVHVTHMDDVGPLNFPSPIVADSLMEVLQVGPGGVSEVQSMRRALPQKHASITALTLHQKEVDLLNQHVPDVRAVTGDMHDMPFGESIFDLILASQVMEHALAPYIALMECRRVLRWGGIAWFIMPSFDMSEGGRGPFHLHCLTEEVWTELLRKTGLDVVNVVREAGATGGVYTSYVCRAGAPPAPHHAILHDVAALKRKG